ncbi:MAG: hypothetical protein KatS3mg022_0047 [Armatimonadota bacterium]|nr:MAG: hypothetical protein KatS3mg022_0047 [Armatimonadota bacterium]
MLRRFPYLRTLATVCISSFSVEDGMLNFALLWGDKPTS